MAPVLGSNLIGEAKLQQGAQVLQIAGFFLVKVLYSKCYEQVCQQTYL